MFDNSIFEMCQVTLRLVWITGTQRT